jgi:hypothetical protein
VGIVKRRWQRCRVRSGEPPGVVGSSDSDHKRSLGGRGGGRWCGEAARAPPQPLAGPEEKEEAKQWPEVEAKLTNGPCGAHRAGLRATYRAIGLLQHKCKGDHLTLTRVDSCHAGQSPGAPPGERPRPPKRPSYMYINRGMNE